MRTLKLTLIALTAFGTVKGQYYDSLMTSGNALCDSLDKIDFQLVNGQNSSSSISNSRYAIKGTISFPGFGNDEDSVKVIRKAGAPVYIEKAVSSLKSTAGITPEARFYNFLETEKSLTGIANPRESFRIERTVRDSLGITHIKAVQQYKGIEIYGSESTMHFDSEHERFMGSFCPVQQNVSVIPQVPAGSAIQIAQDDLKQHTVYKELTSAEKQMLQYDKPDGSLILFNNASGDYALCWEITIRPNFIEIWKYFIDAATGKILRFYNATRKDGPAVGTGLDLNDILRKVDIYKKSGVYYLLDAAEDMYNTSSADGIILTLDANNSPIEALTYTYVTSADTTWAQKTAISAHYNATQAYRYFKNTFGRKTIAGSNGDIVSMVNVTDADGSSMENAFWNGKAIYYGNGGDYFKPLAGALDVTAHEIGHAVVSATANLEYYGQSGSIDEAYADIFAAMVDRDDWLIGEDVVKPTYSPSGAVRNLEDPHNMGDSLDVYWQPEHMSEMYLGGEDNKGVHINSSIGSHAYYFFASDIGKNKAEQVFYRALDLYLTKTSDFVDFRIAVLQAATDLFGSGSYEYASAGRAFDMVGIHDNEKQQNKYLLEVNPGDEFLFTYDTRTSDPTTLYLSTSDGTDFVPMLTTYIRDKVSVTDDGSTAVFASTDHRIRMINTDPKNPNELLLSRHSYYDHIAISKDGKHLAATKLWTDASIYVIDMETNTGRQYILYNPTTSHFNSNSGGVLKAGSICFDPTGEYLVYDAYNIVTSNTQNDIYYWDIGFIKVWDNRTNTFGDGTITKLVESMPDNTNMTNPAFSNTDPYLIAFDSHYENGTTEKFGIFTANIQTNSINRIVSNNMLGYPTFSKDDGKIAYSSMNAYDMQVAQAVRLWPNRASVNGTPFVLAPYAKWPVFFAKGKRILGLPPVANFTVDYIHGHSPLNVRFYNMSYNEPVSFLWQFPGGTPETSVEEFPQVAYPANGTYSISLKVTNSFGTDSLIKKDYIVVSDITDVHDVSDPELVVYPNPVRDFVNIGITTEFTADLFDLQGKLVRSEKNKPKFDVSSLRPGIYILEIRTKDSISRYKMIKE
jgi:bacillolysin